MEKVTVFRTLSKIKKAADHTYITKLPIERHGLSYIRTRCFEGLDEEVSSTLQVDGIRLVTPKRYISEYVERQYEPITRKTFEQALEPGMVVLDVGAHIGYYALLAAKRI